MEDTLDAEVRALLVSRRGDWQVISREAGISHSWISKFVNEHIDNPGYMTLKGLKLYLTGGAATVPRDAADTGPMPLDPQAQAV